MCSRCTRGVREPRQPPCEPLTCADGCAPDTARRASGCCLLPPAGRCLGPGVAPRPGPIVAAVLCVLSVLRAHTCAHTHAVHAAPPGTSACPLTALWAGHRGLRRRRQAEASAAEEAAHVRAGTRGGRWAAMRRRRTPLWVGWAWAGPQPHNDTQSLQSTWGQAQANPSFLLDRRETDSRRGQGLAHNAPRQAELPFPALPATARLLLRGSLKLGWDQETEAHSSLSFIPRAALRPPN